MFVFFFLPKLIILILCLLAGGPITLLWNLISCVSLHSGINSGPEKKTILNTQNKTEDQRPLIILLNKIVEKDVSKEKNVGTWMDSLLLTTSVAFYYDFLLEARQVVKWQQSRRK